MQLMTNCCVTNLPYSKTNSCQEGKIEVFFFCQKFFRQRFQLRDVRHILTEPASAVIAEKVKKSMTGFQIIQIENYSKNWRNSDKLHKNNKKKFSDSAEVACQKH